MDASEGGNRSKGGRDRGSQWVDDEPSAIGGVSAPIRVLHIDDDPQFADMTATYLERENDRLSVRTATSATEGLEILTDSSVDCIVSDYEMPHRTGIDLLNTIREDDPELPFILFTGKGSEEIASEAISAGASDYLQKGSATGQYELLANRITNVVSQYRAQRRSARMARRLQELTETTDDILYMFDHDWSECLFVNSAYEEIFGRSRDRLYEQPRDFLNGVHPDHRDRVRDAMATISNGESVDLEYRVNPDEAYGRWVEVRGEPIRDDDGTVVRIAGFAREITTRKQQEEQLQQSQNRMEFALTATDSIIWDWDIEADQATFYPSEKELYGTSVETLAEFMDVIHPDDRQRVRETLETAIETGEPKYEEFRIVRDGTVRWLEAPGKPVTDGDDVTRLIGVARDITQRKERERELRATNEQLSAVVSNIPVILFKLDSDGVFTISEGQGLDKLGLEPGEVVGESVFDVYGDHERIVEDARRALDGETVRAVYEVRGLHFETTWEPLTGETAGDVTGVIGVSRDVTDHVERERELAAKNERLDQFVSTISHDLRNPLTVARGSLELARDTFESEHLARAVDAIDRSLALIDDLLTLARAGEETVEVQSLVIADVAEQGWQTVETGAATLDIDAPDAIQADRSRLQQLFENLYRNAVEHGSEDVGVVVGTLESGFYVEDDGPGIPPDDREAVFEAGYSTSQDGTGFGLSIVERVVESHEWEINVTEGSEGGARFEITGVADGR